MSWDKTEGGDFGHSSRSENFIRGLNIELANERNLRATAEAEVERLQTENALLRKVVEAANDGNTFALVQALAELDKAKEGQE
jgi:hypothetical protein